MHLFRKSNNSSRKNLLYLYTIISRFQSVPIYFFACVLCFIPISIVILYQRQILILATDNKTGCQNIVMAKWQNLLGDNQSRGEKICIADYKSISIKLLNVLFRTIHDNKITMYGKENYD